MANNLIGEILKQINDDLSTLSQYKNNSNIKSVFEHSFLKEKKFLLPEGVPPYKEKQGMQDQMDNAFFMEARKFYVYCRADLKPIKREQMFISCLESLNEEEAKILIAIKEQELDMLYPNITLESLKVNGFLND